MTPERLKELVYLAKKGRTWAVDGLSDEIERLQTLMKLPEDLEKWFVQINEWMDDDERISDGTGDRVIKKLIITIRALQAELAKERSAK